MMKNIWILILLSTNGATAAPEVVRPAKCPISEIMVRVHTADWTRVDVKAAAGLMGAQGQMIETTTDQLDTCAPLYEEVPSAASRWRLQFGDGSCPRTLCNVTYEATVSSLAEGERARACIIASLEAGGIPSVRDNTFEFVWRSDDSKFRYHLWTTVSEIAGPSQKIRVSMRLMQNPARREDVDFLPFRKGYMGCASQR